MKKVQIIIGSVRPMRVGEQVVDWLAGLLSDFQEIDFELVDLKNWRLPMDDEPDQPARGVYTQQHTRDWSEKISSGDAFIFVTPQYNWGYPASLKNALDHLYREWGGKPALIISYGHRGGVRASDQLRQVLEGLHMKTLEKAPALTFHHEMLDARHLLSDIKADFSQFEASVREAVGDLAKALMS